MNNKIKGNVTVCYLLLSKHLFRRKTEKKNKKDGVLVVKFK